MSEAAYSVAPPNPATGPAPAPLPSTGQPEPVREYHHALRRDGVRWWRGAVAIVLLLVGYLAVNLGLTIGATAIEITRGTYTAEQLAAGQMRLTPLMLRSTLRPRP
jgi:uncharacterized protein